MLLTKLDSSASLLSASKVWEEYRMARMVEVLRLTNRLMTLRMTEEERASMPEDLKWELDWKNDAGKAQLGWLYLVDLDCDVENLVEVLHAQERPWKGG